MMQRISMRCTTIPGARCFLINSSIAHIVQIRVPLSPCHSSTVLSFTLFSLLCYALSHRSSSCYFSFLFSPPFLVYFFKFSYILVRRVLFQRKDLSSSLLLMKNTRIFDIHVTNENKNSRVTY